MEPVSQRQRLLRRWAALKSERSSWLEHWREISDQILPRRSRFLASDRNKPKRNEKIINFTPRRASRTLAAGMMGGLTSPARPWFRLTTPEPSLAESGEVRGWLHTVEERIRLALAKSNVYNCLHSVYSDLPSFGQAALLLEEDDEDLIRGYVFPVGTYALASSARGAIDTVYRETTLTVAQLAGKFGLDACSDRVRASHARGLLDEAHEVLHVVEPNPDADRRKAGPRFMRYRSLWLELAGDDRTGLLREGGYEELPVLCPRWDVTGEDAYGHGPGMDALGDCKALQLLERRKAQLVDKFVNPTMVAPATLGLGARRFTMLPGEVNYVDATGAGAKVEPAYVPQSQTLGVVNESIERHERRVEQAFFADLFLLISQIDGPQMTAREVAERTSEKMLQLGPVLERLQDELLDPLIDRTFAILERAGEIPPAPDALFDGSGVANLRVEYISPLTQAQKATGITSIERLVGIAASLAQLRPDALDKLNVDEVLDVYADFLGVPPDLLVPDEGVAELRAQRAQQEQQAQAMAAAQTAAGAAKDLAGASMENDNALNRIMAGLGDPTALGRA